MKAFWRVAPSVLLRVRAIFLAGIFCRASVFSSRTSILVHSRRFEFLGISSSNLQIVNKGTTGIRRKSLDQISPENSHLVDNIETLVNVKPMPDN